MHDTLPAHVAAEVAAVARIDAVPKILEVVCRTTGMGFSAIARVTDTRWVACAVRDEIEFGLLPGGELELNTTLCDEIRGSGQLVAIDHVAEDETYCGHHTPRRYGFQSYISVPIRLPDGRFFGTLCAIDPRPARVNTPQTIGMFTLFADLIALHLDTQERMATSEAALLDEREAAQLREQFIAILGHDLRNPLAAVTNGVEMLRRLPQTEKGTEILAMVKRSASRMVGLIENVLDLARGRLGGGLPVDRVAAPGIEALLNQIVTELQTASPERVIHRDISIGRPVTCDGARIGQMLSNLLANALSHGEVQSPIWVRAHADDDAFELSVANHGVTIPPHILDRLFHPFVRGAATPGHQGLGLGLYIASEIARAHGGSLTVTSADGETRFTFRMPTHSRGTGIQPVTD